MKGVDQRSVAVGLTPVTLCPVNPDRVAVQIGSPLGAQGAWVNLLFNLDPSATVGMPLFFGQRPMVLWDHEFG